MCCGAKCCTAFLGISLVILHLVSMTSPWYLVATAEPDGSPCEATIQWVYWRKITTSTSGDCLGDTADIDWRDSNGTDKLARTYDTALAFTVLSFFCACAYAVAALAECCSKPIRHRHVRHGSLGVVVVGCVLNFIAIVSFAATHPSAWKDARGPCMGDRHCAADSLIGGQDGTLNNPAAKVWSPVGWWIQLLAGCFWLFAMCAWKSAGNQQDQQVLVQHTTQVYNNQQQAYPAQAVGVVGVPVNNAVSYAPPSQPVGTTNTSGGYV